MLWNTLILTQLTEAALKLPQWTSKKLEQKHDQLAVKFKLGHLNTTRDWLDGLANRIAEEHDLLNHGQVGELVGHYLFTRKKERKNTNKQTSSENEEIEKDGNLLEKLKSHPDVEYYAPQVRLIRDKRDALHRDNNIERLRFERKRSNLRIVNDGMTHI